MKPKLLLLVGLLIFPALLIGFLHLFGQNHFEVRSEKTAGIVLNQLTSQAKSLKGKTVVLGLLPDTLNAADCLYLERILARMDHLSRYGPFTCALQGRTGELATCQGIGGPTASHPFITTLPEQPTGNGRLARPLRLTKEDTVRQGMFFALADEQGRLRNLYDLRKEALLDTLIMETVIVMEE